jgi:hypothetical protein
MGLDRDIAERHVETFAAAPLAVWMSIAHWIAARNRDARSGGSERRCASSSHKRFVSKLGDPATPEVAVGKTRLKRVLLDSSVTQKGRERRSALSRRPYARFMQRRLRARTQPGEGWAYFSWSSIEVTKLVAEADSRRSGLTRWNGVMSDPMLRLAG